MTDKQLFTSHKRSDRQKRRKGIPASCIAASTKLLKIILTKSLILARNRPLSRPFKPKSECHIAYACYLKLCLGEIPL